MNKIIKIFLSRLNPKDTSQEWVQARLEICKKCPFNTDNIVQKSLTDKLKISLNKTFNFIMGKKVTEEATCSICGCMLIYKAAEETEHCPKNKWNKHEPKNY